MATDNLLLVKSRIAASMEAALLNDPSGDKR